MLKANEPAVNRGILGGIAAALNQIWRTLLAGLLVWIPLIITVWVSWFFINMLIVGLERQFRSTFAQFTEFVSRYEPLSFFEGMKYQPGIGVFFAFALFFGTGILTRHLIGRRIIALGERIVFVIPFVNRIYRAAQQIRDVFVGRKGAVFQKVCLIDYPREGMIAVAFVTSTEQGLVQDVMGRELQAVFVPTTPNPTSGYLVYLPPEEITVVDITVEEAMKLIVSAGAYIPGVHAPLQQPGDERANGTPAAKPLDAREDRTGAAG